MESVSDFLSHLSPLWETSPLFDQSSQYFEPIDIDSLLAGFPTAIPFDLPVNDTSAHTSALDFSLATSSENRFSAEPPSLDEASACPNAVAGCKRPPVELAGTLLLPDDAPAGVAPLDDAPAVGAPLDDTPAGVAPLDDAPAGASPLDDAPAGIYHDSAGFDASALGFDEPHGFESTFTQSLITEDMRTAPAHTMINDTVGASNSSTTENGTFVTAAVTSTAIGAAATKILEELDSGVEVVDLEAFGIEPSDTSDKAVPPRAMSVSNKRSVSAVSETAGIGLGPAVSTVIDATAVTADDETSFLANMLVSLSQTKPHRHTPSPSRAAEVVIEIRAVSVPDQDLDPACADAQVSQGRGTKRAARQEAVRQAVQDGRVTVIDIDGLPTLPRKRRRGTVDSDLLNAEDCESQARVRLHGISLISGDGTRNYWRWNNHSKTWKGHQGSFSGSMPDAIDSDSQLHIEQNGTGLCTFFYWNESSKAYEGEENGRIVSISKTEARKMAKDPMGKEKPFVGTII